jgi:hypothetical protein
MLSKNLPYPNVLWIMIARDFLDGISALKGLLSGNGGYFIAIVRSKLGFVKWWFFHRRKSIFPVSRKRKPDGYFDGNIVWLYFGKGLKTFAKIVRKTW